MMQMLRYRTVLLAQTGICYRIYPMALSSTPPQSPASSISALTIVPTVTVRTYPNQKPWTASTELKARAAAFKKRDTNPYTDKKSRYAFRHTIIQATRQYRTKIQSYYTGLDTCRMWCSHPCFSVACLEASKKSI